MGCLLLSFAFHPPSPRHQTRVMRDPYRENLSRITHHSSRSSRLLALLLLLLAFLALFLFLMPFWSRLVLRLRSLLLRFYSRGRRATIVRPGRFLGPPLLRIFTRLRISSRRSSLARTSIAIALLICRRIAFSRLRSLRLFLSSPPPLFFSRVGASFRSRSWGFCNRVSFTGAPSLAC
jgi:hypothetical protein